MMQKYTGLAVLVCAITFVQVSFSTYLTTPDNEVHHNKILGMEKTLLLRLETLCHRALNGDMKAHRAVFCLVGRVCDRDYYIDETSENYLTFYGLLLPTGNLHPLVPKLVINPRIFDLLHEIVGDMWDELTHGAPRFARIKKERK